jgi:hypothetical protein
MVHYSKDFNTAVLFKKVSANWLILPMNGMSVGSLYQLCSLAITQIPPYAKRISGFVIFYKTITLNLFFPRPEVVQIIVSVTH